MNSSTLKRDTILYWITTGLVGFLFISSGIMYLLKREMVIETFTHLGYPSYLVNYLPITKIAGALIIIFAKWNSLKEWAYSGLFINCVLAGVAHGHAQDGWVNAGTIGALIVLASYFFAKRTGKIA